MRTAVEQFDAIIVGAGQSSGPLGTALGAEGWKVAIVEKSHVGGTPPKTLIASATVAQLSGLPDDFVVNAERVFAHPTLTESLTNLFQSPVES